MPVLVRRSARPWIDVAQPAVETTNGRQTRLMFLLLLSACVFFGSGLLAFMTMLRVH